MEVTSTVSTVSTAYIPVCLLVIMGKWESLKFLGRLKKLNMLFHLITGRDILIERKTNVVSRLIFLKFDTPIEEKSFSDFYEGYQKLLYSVAFKILKNEQDTEDALQLSWARIFEHFEKIRKLDDDRKRNFVYTVVKHAAIDIYKKRRREQPGVEDTIEVIDETSMNEISDFVEYSDITQAVNEMNEKYRDPLILMFVYGLSMKEISNILRISEANVGTLIHRGKGMAKKRIQRKRGFHER